MLNRKGDATDIIFFVIIIFFLAVSFIVVIFVNTKIQQAISDTQLNDSQAFSDIDNAFNTINTVTVQRGFILMFAILLIGMQISAFLIRVHPIFFFVYIITIILSIFLGVFISNTYQLLIENATIATVADQQTMINWVMQHLVQISVGAWALSMLVLFGKLFANSGGLGVSDDVIT